MALLRDDPDFAIALGRAAIDLGEHQAFVEKDYWVTQVLRALHETQGAGFLLKGGTSLSKGYGIIDRFSEDVDVLLIRRADQTAASVERRLQEVTQVVADCLGLPWQEMRSPGRGVHGSRGDWIRYPTLPDRAAGLPITADAVLLETRVGEGQEPSEMTTIVPIIARWPVVMGERYDDLSSFEIRVLEPRRTLIEKLVAVHTAVESWKPSAAGPGRFGRHYYDIYHLLGHQPTLTSLTDRDAFARIVDEVIRISRSDYRGGAERPAGGFAVAMAFNPPRETDLRAWIEEAYGLGLELVPAENGRPTFGQVLKRIADRADLL